MVAVLETAKARPSLKSHLLLFDSLALLDLVNGLPRMSSGYRADLEYLADMGLVFDASSMATSQGWDAAGESPHWRREQLYLGLAREVGLLSAMMYMLKGRQSAAADNDAAQTAWTTYINLRLRLSADLLHRRFAQIASPSVPGSWDSYGHAMQLVEYVQRYYGDPADFARLLPTGLVPDIDEGIIQPLERITKIFEDLEANGAERPVLVDTSVARVVIHNLPCPDDTVPLNEIIALRNTPEMHLRLLRLRSWMRDAANGDRSAADLHEELMHLTAEYEAWLRTEKFKLAVARLESLITLVPGMVEDTLKLRFESLSKRLFKIAPLTVALTEAERDAPGREVAYLVHARQQLDGRSGTA